MVIITAQTTALFTESVHVDIHAATHTTVTQEVLEDLAYLVEFDKKSLK